jgi:hypothetical protein
MRARDVIESLHGRKIERLQATGWPGFFDGSLAIENLREGDGFLRFDLIVPTAESDRNDYIWRSEIERGRTEKVLLLQADELIANARITAISREGTTEGWAPAPSEQYRLRFEVPAKSIQADRPLVALFRWQTNEGDWDTLAVASGR